jgi:probable HAF family extracellular repeat protein
MLWLLCGGLLATAVVHAAEYQVIDLGAALPRRINTDGVVAGSVVTHTQQAVIISPDGTVTPRPFLPEGAFSLANGLSASQVVGYSGTGHLSLQAHAFIWSADQGSQDLGTLFRAATDVNQAGTISGYGTRPVSGGGEERRPVVWIAEQIADLGTIGGAEGFADAVNEQGDIVGESQTANGVFHATLWLVDGPPVDLDTLGSRFSLALAVNSTRQVVGEVSLPGMAQRGFRWTPETGMQTLGVLPGDIASTAQDINDAGVIVGTSIPGGEFPPPPPHAVRWVDGAIEDLNTLIDAPGWELVRAQGINDAGWIVGVGLLNGQEHAFLLTPIVLPDEDPPPPRQHRHRHHHHHQPRPR